MRESFASDAEVDALVEGFESGALLPSEFNHHAHMAVALSYVSRMPEEIALGRMRTCVQKFAATHGKSQLYHETLTVFWMRLLSHLSRIYRVDLPLWTRINLIIDRWGTRLPVEAHYSPNSFVRTRRVPDGCRRIACRYRSRDFFPTFSKWSRVSFQRSAHLAPA